MGERFAIIGSAPKACAAARVAGALTRHGADVCIVAPPGSHTSMTRFKRADILMPYAEIHAKLGSILRTLADDFGAHSVLAGDETVFGSLTAMVLEADKAKLTDGARALLARSMPTADKAARLWSESAFIMAHANDRACAPPVSLANPSDDDALRFAGELGYPVAVKRDGSGGGTGVTRCDDAAALRTAVATARECGRFLVQKYVKGRTYGVALSGVEGRAAAAFSFIKFVTTSVDGIGTVLKCDRRDDIIAHARGLYEAYGLNGFVGIDYIVDDSGRAHLLEINRCIVPKSHFAGYFGVDLAGAMLAMMRGQSILAPAAPMHECVALFPMEWCRDPASPYLRDAYHDVPWDDPDLVAAATREIASRLQQRSGAAARD